MNSISNSKMRARVGLRGIERLFLVIVVVITMEGKSIEAHHPHLALSMCPRESASDFIFGFRNQNCVVSTHFPPSLALTEGDEVSLQNALNLVHGSYYQYVVVLFYASWCPFSRAFRPSFSVLSSLYPSIPHFAIEETSIRPSILSKYGVHGFPALFLFNSTMHVQYRGSRNLGSLVAFYRDVTGIRTASLDKVFLDRIGKPFNHEKHDGADVESCPFSWARSPENLFTQETYLALATMFVVLRLLYLFFPTLIIFVQFAWGRLVYNLRFGSLLEHSRLCLNQVMQLFIFLKEPCKNSNFQEGARNARTWASKSLVTVSIRDGSTERINQ